MILRRADEGALKCALRDLRLDDETVALYFIVPVTLIKEGELFAASVSLCKSLLSLHFCLGLGASEALKIERSMLKKQIRAIYQYSYKKWMAGFYKYV